MILALSIINEEEFHQAQRLLEKYSFTAYAFSSWVDPDRVLGLWVDTEFKLFWRRQLKASEEIPFEYLELTIQLLLL